ncbi:MAG TPA: CDP-diacylglycerol--glycerol-3-phosphate 3-phosphatidyltransferase [bacterium]|nr:CDP-diacylglycerol--glycerol-3-phosphate 3-phosphatidyltransferase [bacterium]
MAVGEAKFLNLPNWITIGRLMAAPVILVMMLFLDDDGFRVGANMSLSLASALLFTAAMSSDMLDGWLARRRGITSTFGKFIDPLADKMLFLVAMIMMIPLGRIPAWLVAVFFIREVTVTALRGIAVDEGVVIAADSWGKYKSAFVSTATVGLLLHYPFLGIEWRLIGWIFMAPALFFSVASGLHYSVGFFAGVARRDREGGSAAS